MSVDKLIDSAQLDADLTSVANAIRTANGTTGQLAFPNGFIAGINNLDRREDLTIPKDVDFVDFDGRLLYSYTATEFLALTELPPNPSYPGLVAQGWNWTLADAKEFVGDYGALVIGQNYTTDNGNTRIYFRVPDSHRVYSVNLWLTASVKNGVTIDWGDGNVSVWTGSANGNNTMSHSYTTPGNYILEIKVTQGVITSLGREGANTDLFGGYNVNTLSYYVEKIEIGDNVTSLARNPFKYMKQLKSISMPTTLTTIIDYDEVAFDGKFLNGIVFPINFTTTRYRAMFSANSGIKYVSIPKSMNNFHIDTYPTRLRKLTMYSMQPSSGVTMTIKLYDVPTLTHFVVGGTYGTIQDDTVRYSKIKKIYIPSTVTIIRPTAFAYNSLLEEIHLFPTTPPTLVNASAFNGISANKVFYVPYSADHSILEAYQTATNWSTYASYMQEEPQS